MATINSGNSSREQEIICHCSRTSIAQITRLIENGLDNLESISRMTGAGAGCGACETELLELLEEYSPTKSGIK